MLKSSIALLALALAALVVTSVGASASSAKTRIVDRTVSCTIPLHAGVRLVWVAGQSGVRDQADPSRWFAVSSVNVTFSNEGLVLIQAGTPRTDGAVQVKPSFALSTKACRPTPARVRLRPVGLPDGGRLNQFAEYYKCALPQRVRLRIRGEFRSPVAIAARGGSASTDAPMRRAQIAIQSETGRPLLYADVSEAGPARLFWRSSCTRA